jgi:hypothetical protein
MYTCTVWKELLIKAMTTLRRTTKATVNHRKLRAVPTTSEEFSASLPFLKKVSSVIPNCDQNKVFSDIQDMQGVQSHLV